MPLITIEKLSSRTCLGLWHLTESPEDFALPQQPSIMKQYRSTSRRAEKLATYALLSAMTGDDDLLISHESSGRPLLEGWHISISHTRGYVAVILSRDTRVAVDIEYVANRVNKETAYKYFSEQQLAFFEMRLSPFPLQESGCLEIENLRSHRFLNIHYRQNNAYVLTFTY